MSAKDAEVTEADRRAVCGVYWSNCAIGKLVEIIANTRRAAYRAGQIAGLEEGFKIAMTYSGWATNAECEAKLDARIRELKGET